MVMRLAKPIRSSSPISESTLYPFSKLEASGFFLPYSRSFRGVCKYSLTNRGVEQLVTLRKEWTLYRNRQRHHRSIRHDKNWLSDSVETYLHKLPEADRIKPWTTLRNYLTMQVQKAEELIASLGTPKKLPWYPLIFSIKGQWRAPAQKNDRQLLHCPPGSASNS